MSSVFVLNSFQKILFQKSNSRKNQCLILKRSFKDLPESRLHLAKMNCTSDPNASVTQFVYKTYTILHDYFSNLDHNENETKVWFLMRFDLVDYFMIAVFAFFWKCTREFFMKNISQVSLNLCFLLIFLTLSCRVQ